MGIADLPIPEGKYRKRHRMRVDGSLCDWKKYGCDRLCTAVFRCPGVAWAEDRQVAVIDHDKCRGCGACSPICPGRAIKKDDWYGVAW